MKIKVKNIWAILANELVSLLPKLATAFMVIYVGAILIYSVAREYGVPVITWLPSVLAILAVVLLLAKRVLEIKLLVQGTFLELRDKSIFCTISGFNNRSFSIPLNQVSSIHIQQSFIDKLFGICRVVIVQIASTSVVYGFDYDEGLKFSDQFTLKRVKLG